jgi:hypothetical protein
MPIHYDERSKNHYMGLRFWFSDIKNLLFKKYCAACPIYTAQTAVQIQRMESC